MTERWAGEEPGRVPPWGTPPSEPGGSPESPQSGSAEPPPYGSPEPGQRSRRKVGRAAGGVAVGGALATKAGLIGKVFIALKAVGFLAKFKVLGSMLISVGAYALFWGWKFALGFVLLLLVHELGHVVVLRLQGVPASAPMFIPFLGAFVQVKGEQRSVAEEAWSALAGPVAGTVGAFAVLQLADLSGSPLLRALAYTAFLINLFNLIPALPLDGGRVAGALHPAIWWIGIGAVVALLLWRPSPVLFLVVILGGFEAFRRWRARRSGVQDAYYSVPSTTRTLIGVCYIAVAIGCIAGMHFAYVPRPF